MRKAFTLLAASLCLLASCNIDGEEPLEEGVMTPEEFFEEIEAVSAKDLADGWWTVSPGCFEKDKNGNYKEVAFYHGCPYSYYFNISDGKIEGFKELWYDHDWKDIALDGKAQIDINKNDRLFSIYTPEFTLIDHILIKCEHSKIITIDSDAEKEIEKGECTFMADVFGFIGTELPREENSSNNE